MKKVEIKLVVVTRKRHKFAIKIQIYPSVLLLSGRKCVLKMICKNANLNNGCVLNVLRYMMYKHMYMHICDAILYKRDTKKIEQFY